MTQHISLAVCHDCDLIQKITSIPRDGVAKCNRCDAVLRKRQRIAPERSIEHTLALVIAAIVLFIISNSFPIISLRVEGNETSSTLFSGVAYLISHDMKILSALVFLTTIGAPLLQLSVLLSILLPIHFHRTPRHAPQWYLFMRIISNWSMLEVFMLGILVSIVKFSALATVIPGIALWSFGVLMLLLAAILGDLDTETLWRRIGGENGAQVQLQFNEGKLTHCHTCGLLCQIKASVSSRSHCPRCHSLLYFRKPDSLSRCSAWLIAALILYIPANIFPIMSIKRLGNEHGDTIIGGVIYLAKSGDWPLALIVFIASVFVPLLKLVVLSLLVISVHYHWRWWPVERTRLYRMTEVIGRWSMVDIYVVTLMAALIQIQGVMVIEVGIGALAFGAVVVLTLFSATAFDPRLIWDNQGN